MNTTIRILLVLIVVTLIGTTPAHAEYAVQDGDTFTYILDEYTYEEAGLPIKNLDRPLFFFNCVNDPYMYLCVPNGAEFSFNVTFDDWWGMFLFFTYEDETMLIINGEGLYAFNWVEDIDWNAYREDYEGRKTYYEENLSVEYEYTLIETADEIGIRYSVFNDNASAIVKPKMDEEFIVGITAIYVEETIYDKETGVLTRVEFDMSLTANDGSLSRVEVLKTHLKGDDNGNAIIPGFEFGFLSMLMISYVLRRKPSRLQ